MGNGERYRKTPYETAVRAIDRGTPLSVRTFVRKKKPCHGSQFAVRKSKSKEALADDCKLPMGSETQSQKPNKGRANWSGAALERRRASLTRNNT